MAQKRTLAAIGWRWGLPELPCLRGDEPLELFVLAAVAVPTNSLNPRQIAARLVDLALSDMQRTRIVQRGEMAWIGRQGAVVPPARFGVAAELRIGKADRARNIWMIVITKRLHRRDAGLVLAAGD